jgi:hypothetical protein
MARKLFLTVDPVDLDRYTRKKVPRRTSKNIQVVRGIDLLKRALQSLPPRELAMLYAVKVLRVEQDDISERFKVRQSNISYRLERACTRIQLHFKIAQTCSETALRRVLYDIGLAEPSVRAVLGVVKTTSQSATANTLKVTQGSVRHIFATAIARLREKKDQVPDGDRAYKLLTIIESSYNQLRSISIQSRWAWKVGNTNYPTPREQNKEKATKVG